MSREACAQFLGVSLRTVRYWEAGRCRVPWSAVRLLRLHRLGDLGALHDAWAGWTLHARTGELVSPNGYRFEPGKLALWPLLCEQARFWRQDFARRTAGGVGAKPPRGEAVTLLISTSQVAVTLVGPRPAPELAASMPRPATALERTPRAPAGSAGVAGRAGDSCRTAGALPDREELAGWGSAMTLGAFHGFNLASQCHHVAPEPRPSTDPSMPPQTALRSRLSPVASKTGGVPVANRGPTNLNGTYLDANLTSPPVQALPSDGRPVLAGV
jgi:hypothetical protein